MTTCKLKRTMRKLSLFSGIGGLDLAAKLAGVKTIIFYRSSDGKSGYINLDGVSITGQR